MKLSGKWVSIGLVGLAISLSVLAGGFGLLKSVTGSTFGGVSSSGGVITVDPGVRYQTMKGWEGTAQLGQTEASNFQLYQDEVVDRLVNELGINRMRLESHQGRHAVEPTNDNADPQVINAAGFDFTNFDYDIDTVVLPIRQAMAANGEQLYVNFNTVAVAHNSDAFHKDPDEFAEFVLAHFLHMESRYGFVPDAVEMSLEPDVFNTFDEDGAQIGAALVATGDRLAANGFTDVDFIAPSGSGTGTSADLFEQLVTVPRVMEYLTELSYHTYGGTTPDIGRLQDLSAQYGVSLAMLERIGVTHNNLHFDLTQMGNVAWQQFTLAFPTGDNGGQYYWIDSSNPSSPQVNIGSRTQLLRQYFKFVRLGAQRIEASTSDGDFRPVAFINANGRYVVVVKADVGGSFSVAGLPTGTYGVNYSTSSQFDVDLADVSLGSGDLLDASIPASGVLTVYQKQSSTPQSGADIYLCISEGPLSGTPTPCPHP